MADENPEGVKLAYEGYGRAAVPPPGKIFVRDPAAASAKAVRDSIARFESVGAEVPEHLASLASALDDEQGPLYVAVDSDFPPEAGRYFEAVDPVMETLGDLRTDSEREADENAATARAEAAARAELAAQEEAARAELAAQEEAALLAREAVKNAAAAQEQARQLQRARLAQEQARVEQEQLMAKRPSRPPRKADTTEHVKTGG